MTLLKIVLFSLAGIGGISCLYYYKSLSRVYLWLGIFLLFAMISQLVGIYLSYYVGRNIEYYNVVIAINFLLQYRIFLKLSNDSFYRTRIHSVFAVGALIIAYLLFRYFNVSFASQALTVLNIIVVVYALLYFYQMLRTPSVLSVFKHGEFWIATGFLIHHISLFSYWLTYEFLFSTPSWEWISVMSYSLTVLQYAIMIVSIFVKLKFNRND